MHDIATHQSQVPPKMGHVHPFVARLLANWHITGYRAHFKRYPDGCYALVRGNRRGPCGNSCLKAWQRFQRSGFVAFASEAK